MYGDGKIAIENKTIYDTKVFLVEMRLDLKKNIWFAVIRATLFKTSQTIFFIFFNIILSIHLVSLKNNQKYDI